MRRCLSAEMMGGDSYQLSPGKSVMFKAGKMSGATAAPADCGCPETAARRARRKAAPAALRRDAATPAAKNAAEAHLEVNGAFVYRGKDAVQDYSRRWRGYRCRETTRSWLWRCFLRSAGRRQIPKPPAKKAGVLHRFGNFFGHLFNR